MLLDELVKRGQGHAPATDGIEVHFVAFDVVPDMVLDVQRVVSPFPVRGRFVVAYRNGTTTCDAKCAQRSAALHEGRRITDHHG